MYTSLGSRTWPCFIPKSKVKVTSPSVCTLVLHTLFRDSLNALYPYFHSLQQQTLCKLLTNQVWFGSKVKVILPILSKTYCLKHLQNRAINLQVCFVFMTLCVWCTPCLLIFHLSQRSRSLLSEDWEHIWMACHLVHLSSLYPRSDLSTIMFLVLPLPLVEKKNVVETTGQYRMS